MSVARGTAVIQVLPRDTPSFLGLLPLALHHKKPRARLSLVFPPLKDRPRNLRCPPHATLKHSLVTHCAQSPNLGPISKVRRSLDSEILASTEREKS